VGGPVQHLVHRHVVQHEARGLDGIDAGRHRYEFGLRQADELRVRAADRKRGNALSRLDTEYAVRQPIDVANQFPAGCEGQGRRLRMNTLAHHQVGE
jgi:hypothetical protein